MTPEHTHWFLFAWVFGNQAGIPLPVVPGLLGAGVLAAGGRLQMTTIISLVVAASLAADLIWYGLGRSYGAWALNKSLGRFAPTARILAPRAQRVYTARLPVFQLGARFLPELNAISAGMAGAVHASIGRFVGYAVVSALVWAGVWVGLGYVFGHALTVTAGFLGIRLVVLFVGSFTLYLPFRRTRRHRLIRMVRGASTTPRRPHDLRHSPPKQTPAAPHDNVTRAA
jgi:membrane protein DedA with SNARE-associated domain